MIDLHVYICFVAKIEQNYVFYVLNTKIISLSVKYIFSDFVVVLFKIISLQVNIPCSVEIVKKIK